MLIRVSEIPEEGLQIEGAAALPHPFADGAWSLEELSLKVDRDGRVVFVRGRLAARVPLTCCRCLEPFQLTVEPEVDARLEPSPEGRTEERQLGADDLETDLYHHDTLDLGAVVETETTLGLPMKPLCRESCRGLCPICGANGNVTACACQAAPAESRWAALTRLAERLPK